MKLHGSIIVTEKLDVTTNSGHCGTIYDMQSAAILGVIIDADGNQISQKKARENGVESYSVVQTCNSHQVWLELELPTPLADFEKFKRVRAAFIRCIVPILENRRLMFQDFNGRCYKEVKYPYDSIEFYIEER